MTRTQFLLTALAFLSVGIVHEIDLRLRSGKTSIYAWKVRLGSIFAVVACVVFAVVK